MTAFWWQPFLKEILLWWLAVTGLGWLAWPICFRCQALLPDRGLATAKLAGLMLWAFARAWLLYGATAKSRPIGAGAAGWWAAGIVAAFAAVAFARSGRATVAWTWANRRSVLRTELAFAGLFAAGLWLRSLIPDATWDVQWAGAEKWGNLAIVTGVWRHDAMPPLDPWLAGYTLNYYFFSHFVWGSLARLTGAAPPVAFNLAMATLAALLVLGAWSAGRTLAERSAGGWWGLFLVAVAGTPITLFQAPRLLGLLRQEGFAAMLRGFDFWGPSSIRDDSRYEFPAFNVLLGDLHAHALGLVVLLWALCLLAQLRRARDVGGGGGWWRLAGGQAPTVALLAVVVGCMWATNGWDVGVLGLVVLGWVALESARSQSPGEGLALAASGCVLASAFAALAVGRWGLAAFFSAETRLPLIVLDPTLAKLPGPLSVLGSLGLVDAAHRTRPSEWLEFWGFLVLPAAWVLAPQLARAKGWRRAAGSLNSPLYAVATLVLLALVLDRPRTLGGVTPVVALGLAGALACVAAALAKGARESRLTAAAEWALLLGGVSLFLQLVPEIVYVADPISPQLPRYNTVFKLYYPAWALAALAGALALSEWAAARRARERGPEGALAWEGNLAWDGGGISPPAAMPSASSAHEGRVLPVRAETRPWEEAAAARALPSAEAPTDAPTVRAYECARPLIVAAAVIFVALAGAYSVLGVGRRVAKAFERVHHAVADEGVTPRTALAECRTLDATAFLALPEYGAGDDRLLGLWMRDQWRPEEAGGRPLAPSASPGGDASAQASDQPEKLGGDASARRSGSTGFLLEWGCDSYTMAGRFAVLSGVPTFLGWAGHESQWRGSAFGSAWMRRESVQDLIYGTLDAEEARGICRDLRIRWVAVGLLERRQFADSPESLRKFDRIGRVVHREGGSVLYEIDWQEP